MECLETELKDAKLIMPKVFADARGFFLEGWRQNSYDQLLNQGRPLIFVQDNHSKSTKHVIRGLHFQYQCPQGKLVRVLAGKIHDVIVDLRADSPTFGRWQGFDLSADNKHMLWVPPGFAHGFYTLEDDTEVLYKCSGHYYNPQDEQVIMWNDVSLGISWPLLAEVPPAISPKDSLGETFVQAPKFLTANIYA